MNLYCCSNKQDTRETFQCFKDYVKTLENCRDDLIGAKTKNVEVA